MPRMRSNDVTLSFGETGADRDVVFDIVVAFGDRVAWPLHPTSCDQPHWMTLQHRRSVASVELSVALFAENQMCDRIDLLSRAHRGDKPVDSGSHGF